MWRELYQTLYGYNINIYSLFLGRYNHHSKKLYNNLYTLVFNVNKNHLIFKSSRDETDFAQSSKLEISGVMGVTLKSQTFY